MKRHIYAFDTPHAARAAIHQLHEKCDIGDHAISLIANSSIQLDEIPRRYRDATTDFVPALGRGATIGAAIGLCAGLISLTIASLGASSATALVGLVFIGALVGAWASALTGASVPDQIRRKYADELAAGRILLVVTTRHADTDAELAHTMTDRHDCHLLWQSEVKALTT